MVMVLSVAWIVAMGCTGQNDSGFLQGCGT